MAILEVHQLSAAYNGLKVLDAVSMSVETGEIVAIFGPNGAGKSSLLKVVAGLLSPAEGSIQFKGDDITRLDSHSRAKQGISFLLQGGCVFPHLTVMQNLQVGCRELTGDDAQCRINIQLELFPGLRQRCKTKAGSLSGGERQRLALATVLLSNSSLLLLDEPFAGIDAAGCDGLSDHLRNLNHDRGITIVLVEQNLPLAIDIADRAFVLAQGQVVWSGPSRLTAIEQIVCSTHNPKVE